MKKVTAIINNITNEKLPIEKMEIRFIGENYVMANFKGYGFAKTYGPWDGYTVVIENN